MLRCALLATTVLVAGATQAQTHRHFPADALRGQLQILVAPDVRLNGRPARLSPGSRIQGERGLGQLPGELGDRAYLVHYTLHGDGQIKDVWILNAAERANALWPVSREQAAAWRFDPAGQTWSRP